MDKKTNGGKITICSVDKFLPRKNASELTPVVDSRQYVTRSLKNHTQI